jgi:tRNA A-37 threonylcarbamoyl transferase component Bud32
VGRGLVPAGAAITIEALVGGVSSDLTRATGPGFDLVVKRSLPRLRVEEEWLADPGRVLNEARALQLAADLVPGAVPAVVDVDPEALTVVLEHAPSGWANWRDRLLQGVVDPSVAESLGTALGAWHAGTAGARIPWDDFGDQEVFRQLRISPFFETAARRHPALAGRIHEVAAAMLGKRRCLVHGDFSPKNVLAGERALWVLDWEVAHVGNPVFDLAFMLTHLGLKSLHLPARSAGYRNAAAALLRAYDDAGLAVEVDELVATVACLLLARVDGKSQASYLTPPERESVRALAAGMLERPPGHPLDLWRRLPAGHVGARS